MKWKSLCWEPQGQVRDHCRDCDEDGMRSPPIPCHAGMKLRAMGLRLRSQQFRIRPDGRKARLYFQINRSGRRTRFWFMVGPSGWHRRESEDTLKAGVTNYGP